jgi:ATP-binding cassette subfamily C protein
MSPQHLLSTATKRQCLVWIKGALARYKLRLALTLMCSAVAAATALVPVYILGGLVDDVRAGAPTSTIVRVIVMILLAALAAGLLGGLASYLITELGEKALANLRERTIEHALLIPIRQIEEVGKGDLLSRVGDDISVLAKAVGQVVPPWISSMMLVTLSLAAILNINVLLGLAALASLPLGLAALLWYLRRSGVLFANERVAMGERSQALVAGMQGARTVHAYGLEDAQVEHIGGASMRARDKSIGAYKALTRFVGLGKTAQFVGLAAMLWVGFHLVVDNTLTVGQATTALLLYHRLFNPMEQLLFSFSLMQSAGASLARLVGVINSEIVRSGGTAAKPADATLELRNLEYSYDGRNKVLHGVSITIEAGSRVAMVGSTGAGKTTVAAIAAGALTPDSGTARIGGVNLADLGLQSLRKHVAIISQDVHVFSGPLFEDLRLANPFADHDALHNALRTVGALEWVEKLPEGIATMVGEGGFQLTAAQAQQIALARLVLADPPVAVLDEATAEAGSAGARELERYAFAATEGRTTLIVAHRLTQASHADRIVVLEGGRVVEEGTHAALIQRGGRYAQLWDAWEGRMSEPESEYPVGY